MATKEIKEGIYVSALKKDNAELTKQNYDLMKKHKVKTSDPVVNNVIERIFLRHQQGMKKFKKTMAENSKPIDDWIEDIIEELIDAVCYLTTVKERIHNAHEYIKKENDLLRDDLQISSLEAGRMMEKINKLEKERNDGKKT